MRFAHRGLELFGIDAAFLHDELAQERLFVFALVSLLSVLREIVGDVFLRFRPLGVEILARERCREPERFFREDRFDDVLDFFNEVRVVDVSFERPYADAESPEFDALFILPANSGFSQERVFLEGETAERFAVARRVENRIEVVCLLFAKIAVVLHDGLVLFLILDGGFFKLLERLELRVVRRGVFVEIVGVEIAERFVVERVPFGVGHVFNAFVELHEFFFKHDPFTLGVRFKILDELVERGIAFDCEIIA